MKYAALTDKGLVRKKNEDSFLATDHVIAVADGMGGHEAGGLASQTALAQAAKVLEAKERRPKAALVRAFSAANASVLQKARESNLAGMGTTMTMALFANRSVWIGHIGDSRAYLLRGGELSQLTQDHSLVEDLVRSGSLSRKEANTHPRKNIITKAIGVQKTVKPDIFSVALHVNDRLILCTDGLTNHVDAPSLAKLAATGSPQETCRRLIEVAKDRGGSDNITAIVVDIVSEGSHSPVESGWRNFVSSLKRLIEKNRS